MLYLFKTHTSYTFSPLLRNTKSQQEITSRRQTVKNIIYPAKFFYQTSTIILSIILTLHFILLKDIFNQMLQEIRKVIVQM